MSKTNWNAVSAISTAFAATVGLVALIFLICEFKELRRSNDINWQAVRESKRPIGIISFYNPEYQFFFSKDGKLFSFKFEKSVLNAGQGVLSYIGHFSFLCKQQIDFRRKFLGGEINKNDIRPDWIYSYARKEPILPNEKNPIHIICNDVQFDTLYYLYTIHIYEDLNGQLYDTEHLDVLMFEKPFMKKGQMRTRSREGTLSLKETFHYYTPEERHKLIEILRSMKNPIAEIF